MNELLAKFLVGILVGTSVITAGAAAKKVIDERSQPVAPLVSAALDSTTVTDSAPVVDLNKEEAAQVAAPAPTTTTVTTTTTTTAPTTTLAPLPHSIQGTWGNDDERERDD